MIQQYNLPWLLPDHEHLKDRLIETHSHSSREYHNLLHLSEMFTNIDELRSVGEVFHEDVVNLAVWYHDAVYDTDPNPERRSAQLAESELKGVVRDETLDKVTQLILLTETHKPKFNDTNGKVVCDADLAILAANPERYIAYTKSVRKEYSAVPDRLYAQGRISVLQNLLQGKLFHTVYGEFCWEESAKQNISREIAKLTSTLE